MQYIVSDDYKRNHMKSLMIYIHTQLNHMIIILNHIDMIMILAGGVLVQPVAKTLPFTGERGGGRYAATNQPGASQELASS